MTNTVIVSIIVALIPAVASIICQMIISNKNHRDDGMRKAADQQKLDDRLVNIEKKLDEHNQYAKKIGQIERSLIRIDTIISINRRNSNAKKHFKR